MRQLHPRRGYAGLLPPPVSAAIQELEGRVGARLLNRTTRQVAPGSTCFASTPASSNAPTSPARGYAGLPVPRVGGHPGTGGPGRRAAPEPHHAPGRAHARARFLRALPAPDRRHGRGREPVRQASVGPRGVLRVDVPGRVGRLIVAPALPAFLGRVSADRHHAGRDGPHVNLIEEGVDCAARGRAAGFGAGGAHDGQAAAHQRRQPGLSGAPACRARRRTWTRMPACTTPRRPRAASRHGNGWRAGRAYARCRSRHGQQCRSLYRQLPGGPGADPDPGL